MIMMVGAYERAATLWYRTFVR